MTKTEEIRKWETERGITLNRIQVALGSCGPIEGVTATIVDTPAGYMVLVEELGRPSGEYVTPEAILSAHDQGGLEDLIRHAASLL